MKLSTVARRLLASAATLTVGAVGALAVASPASAHHPEVTGDVYCDVTTGEYVAEWTLETFQPSGVEAEVTEVSVTMGELSTITVGARLKNGGPLKEEQRLPGDTTGELKLTVEVKWDNGHEPKSHYSGPHQLAGDCEASSEVVADYDCETFDLSIENKSNEEATFTVVPSEGDSVDVTVPAGETSESVSFDSQEGLAVDVERDGESVLEDGPIEITSEDWKKLDCGDDGGEGGGSNEDEELPVTGSTTLLIAGAAVALLALGGGLFLVARRRRLTFTA